MSDHEAEQDTGQDVRQADNPVTSGDEGTPTPDPDTSGEPEHHAGDSPAAERAGIYEKPDDDELAEIEEERKRRLDPDNRPDGAEVDNTDKVLVDEKLVPRDEVDDPSKIQSD